MKIKFNLITLTAIVLLFASSLKAQTTTPDFKASHLKAAEQYLIATGINTQFGDITDNIINSSSTRMPEEHRVSFAKVMKAFMNKYYTWDNLKPALCKIYATEFTEDELNQLAVFYNTPLGKKASSKIPLLMQKGMTIGEQLVADHRPELEQMMKDAFKEDGPPTVKELQH